MHSYLHSIGFVGKNIRLLIKEIVNNILKNDNIIHNHKRTSDESVEIFKNIHDKMGIGVNGNFSASGDFDLEFCFPYVMPSVYNRYTEISIEKNVCNNSFSGSFEVDAIGIMVIFSVQNGIDFINYYTENYGNPVKDANGDKCISAKVGLVAYSLDGKIIMPLQRQNDIYQNNINLFENKKSLINQAKNGDEEAIELLSIEEMDIYSKISKRILNEDVLTIVDTSFMPIGIECDRYNLIGEIIEVEVMKNVVTEVEVYNLLLNCNDITLNLVICKEDLIGEPKIGRRFKGSIWLQGRMDFSEE